VLAPVLETVSLSSLNVVYTLSASCFGESGVSELAAQTMDLLNSREVSSSLFPLQLAFNMIPLDDGSHLASELGTLKELQNLPISTQSILVPAFHGMCIAVSLQAEQDIDPQQIEQIFADSEDVQIQQHVASPFTHCREGDKSLIFGLNQQQNDAKKLQFWIIADSVRNGLLKNYQQAIDFLLNSHL
jgi:aspartate-semialdehyde dehydrogenase